MGFEDNPIVQVSPSSDANPLHVQALPDHCRQARTQLARIDGALERCTEARQQFVAAEPLAEDPPVGETLEGAPRRLEYQGHENRAHHRGLDRQKTTRENPECRREADEP